MSHHGREDERPEPCGAECSQRYRQLQSALKVIRNIAFDDMKRNVGSVSVANKWLREQGLANGDTLVEEVHRERRAAELDAEIERLRAERAKL